MACEVSLREAAIGTLPGALLIHDAPFMYARACLARGGASCERGCAGGNKERVTKK